MNIDEIIKSGENETIEFKKSTGEREEAMKDLCAFANKKGGSVIFGTHPNTFNNLSDT